MLEIRKELQQLANADLAEFNRKLMTATSRPMLGVRVPDLRKLARQIARDDWRTWINSPADDDCFEEILLRGMVIGYTRTSIDEMLSLIADYIPLVDDWALCDCACATWKMLIKHPDRTFEFIAPYLSSEEEFPQRVAYITLLSHFCTSTYIQQVVALFSTAQPKGYYAQMGLAWALSTCYLKYPKETVPLFKNPTLPLECRRKALQKIQESRRLTEAMRTEVQVLRRTIKRYA